MIEKQEQRSRDSIKLEKYLDVNLGTYFRGKEYTIQGVQRSKDVYGEAYKTYSYLNYDVCFDFINGGWHSTLNQVKRKIDNIIDGLILAKTCEKPEGGAVCIRRTEVHWRSFPKAETNDDFRVIGSPDCIKITFRLNVHHKE